MPKIFWFKFCPADWLKDTQHLDRCEEGSYLLLCLHYYVKRRPLPDNDKRLAAIAKCPPTEWPATREVLSEFFIIEQGLWKHKRIEDALKEQAAESKKQSENAKKRWAHEQSMAAEYGLAEGPHATPHATPMPENMPNASMSESQSESQSDSEITPTDKASKYSSKELPAQEEGSGGHTDYPGGETWEQNLMRRCTDLFGEKEMALNGGLWRTRAREDADKLDRVLQDIKRMKKEGVPVHNLPACATDLWKRFASRKRKK